MRYHLGGWVEIAGALHAPWLLQALEALPRAHEALRLRLHGEDADGLPLQSFDAEAPAVRQIDVSSHADPEAAARRWIDDRFTAPFAPDGPFVEFALVTLGPERHWWVQKYHHLAVDGWGISQALQWLATAYAALAAGADMPPADTAWSRHLAEPDPAGPAVDAAMTHWTALLAERKQPLWPARGRPQAPADDAESIRSTIALRADRYAAYAASAAACGVSTFHLLGAALAAAAARGAGKSAVAIGAPMLNRSGPAKGTIGLFASMQLLPVRIDRNASLGALARQLAATARGNYRHRAATLGDALLRQHRAGEPAAGPFDLTLSYERHDYAARMGTATCHAVAAHAGQDAHPLAVYVREFHAGRDVQVDFDWRFDCLDEEAVVSLQDRFVRLLDAAVVDATTPLRRLEALDAQQAGDVLSWGCREAVPGDLVPQRVLAAAQRTPAAVALRDGQGEMTYAALAQRSERWARALRAAGVRPGDTVALVLPRGNALVVAMLAAWRAGAAYMPIDPEQPPARRAAMLAQAAVRLQVGEHAGAVSPLQLDQMDAPDFAEAAPHPQQAAYVLSTSGSTGTPKGVVVSHAALAAHMAWMQQRYPLAGDDRVLQKTPVGFDASVWEFWAPLVAGAQLLLAPPGAHRQPDLLGRLLREQAVTVLQTTPTLLQALLDAGELRAPLALRRLFAGGEALPMAAVAALAQALPGVPLVNLYGPTEACIEVTAWDCDVQMQDTIASLGQPIAGARLYVVDSHGELVPPGVPGELWIGGAGVARGYLGQPGLTAQRFVPDPYAAEAGARAYRSGDLVRWRAGGRLDYLGRIDGQLKLRGYRIEPGEVEAVLAGHPAVARAAVAVRTLGGTPQLVAYLVAQPGQPQPDTAQLRAWLLERLPTYFVPAHCEWLPALPMTASGKLDRAALPQPQRSTQARQLPRTPTEIALAALWQDLLACPPVHVDDDFFALGGHSLRAMQLAVRLRELHGVEPPLRLLFDEPTLARQAAAVDALRRRDLLPSAPPLRPLASGAPRPLSFGQQRLWFLAQWPDGAIAYHMAGGVELRGALDTEALARALGGIVARHEALRTVFELRAGTPWQRAQPAPDALPLPLDDLEALPASRQDEEVAQRAAAEAQAPFDLSRDLLLRTRLLRLAPQRHVLLFTLHHIAADGWSGGVLVAELATLYDRACGRASAHGELRALPVQYADFAAWQRAWLDDRVLAPQIAYWRDRLRRPPVLELPGDHARPSVLSARGGHHAVSWDTDLTQQLRSVCRAQGVTPFMAMLAGFALLLGRRARQDDVIVGTPVANRPHSALEPLIGFFTNTLALRLDLSGNPSFADLLQRARHTSLDAYDRPDVPFERLVEELQLERSLSHTPLFQAMIAWQLANADSITLSGLEVQALPQHFSAAKFDLMLSVDESPHSIACRFDYRADLFDHGTVVAMANQFTTLMRAALGAPGRPAWQLPLLDAQQAGDVLSWGCREAVPGDLVPQRVLAAARRTPAAVALRDGQGEMTYAALAQRSARWARALRAAGVRPGDTVALVVPRGNALVVAMLAAWRAGAAYMPIDPEEPPARRAALLAQAAVRLQVGEHAGAVSPLQLDQMDAPDFAEAAPHPQQAAYVLSTSGSTGTPKGVVVSHAALAAHMAWMQQRYPLAGDDRVLQKTPVGFDASVWEFWAPLVAGAQLLLAPPGAHRQPDLLGRLLREQAVTVLQTTPTLLQALLDAGELRAPLALRRLFAGGEALPMAAVAALAQALPGVPLVNLYGPTEACIEVTAWDCDVQMQDTIASLGQPIAGARLYVVDSLGELVPPGVPGELWIGGAGVARGYLGQPGLTAQRFVPDPYAAEAGARAYRSGDLVRWRAGGSLDYLGRIDGQLKLRGYRIEPGEVEAVLAGHPAVARAAVAVRTLGGTPQLVAYLVAQPGQPQPDTAQLRAWLLERLPTYFVPAHCEWLPALPMTASGKLDRAALPQPQRSTQARQLPRTPTEIALAALWQDLLACPPVHVDDDFFALGGHSLRAVQLVARLHDTFLVDVPLRRIFEHSTLAGLAHAVEELAADQIDPDLAAMLADLEQESAPPEPETA